jgi:hypothetical protein
LVALLQSCLLQGCLIERLSLQPSDAAVDTRTDAFGDVDAFRALDAFSDIDGALDASVPVPDAFVVVPDAFVPVPDAFVPVPDAFVPLPDAFDCSRVTEACNAIDDDCDTRVDEGACSIGGAACVSSVFRGRVYLVCTSSANWDTARTHCQALGDPSSTDDVGYDLVSLTPPEETDFALGVTASDVWVGLGEDGGRVPGATNENWRWLDGATVLNRDRYGIRQDSGSALQCGRMLGNPSATESVFRDSPCGEARPFMCEAAIRSR